MTKTEFTIEVPGVGKVDVVRQDNGLGDDGKQEYFWDFFDHSGTCLNEGNAFWSKPTKKEVLTFFKDEAQSTQQ